MVNFPTRIPDCDSHSPALLDLLISSNGSICSTVAFPPSRNSGYVVVSVFTDVPFNSKGDAPFIVQLMAILVQTGIVFVII